jgi:vacuolar-type H+-ATPase subunit I/STV1
MMAYTYAQRLEVIEQKRAKLERRISDLQRKEKSITASERAIQRKELAREKYRLGGLILLAQAKIGGKLSDEALLGALLQIFNDKEPDKIKSWERYGAGLLKTQRSNIKESASAQGFTQAEVRTK